MGQAQRIQRQLESAVAQFQSGQLDSAASACEELLRKRPKEAMALHILGAVRLRQNDADGAIRVLKTARKLQPGNSEILSNLGAAYRSTGDQNAAIEALDQATRADPRNSSAFLNLGNAHGDSGHAEAAIAAYRSVLRLVPDHLEARRSLANNLQIAGIGEEAVSEYDALNRVEPNNPDTLNALGVLHAEQGHLHKAQAFLERAHELRRDDMDISTNLGNVLALMFRVDEAAALYSDVISRSSETPELLCNLGNALARAGRAADAAEKYTSALSLDPENADAHASLANNLLGAGRFEEGWKHYLYRPSTREISGQLHRSPLGPDLSGTTIAVTADQGLGDQIFFARFFTELRRRGTKVVYRPENRLRAMLERAEIADGFLVEDADLAGDYMVSAGDLPFLLDNTASEQTPSSFEIPALPERMAALEEKLTSFGPPPYTGVTWRAGTPNLRLALSKEVPSEELGKSLSGTDGTIVIVQRGGKPEEIAAFLEALGRTALDLSHVNDDMEDMLALMALLDHYVGVSNTLTHMRAARKLASHVLVPQPTEFRWMNAGDESPWFPGSTVYRQSPDGGWTEALRSLTSAMGN